MSEPLSGRHFVWLTAPFDSNDDVHGTQPVPQSHSKHKQTLLARAVPVVCLFVSTIISILLACSAYSSWRTSGLLYSATVHNRASVQIVVHIISSLLGTSQVLVICTLLRWHLNIRSARKAISLDTLSLWTAICGRSFDFSLGQRQLSRLVMALTMFELLGQLWVGSTTPVITVDCWNGTLYNAQYSMATIDQWNVSRSGAEYDITNPNRYLKKGIFGWRPWSATAGEYLNQAARASTIDGSPTNHSKTDNSGYSYSGRSYGAGASVGLLNIPNDVASYSFLENGYASHVQCWTNTTANMTLAKKGGFQTTADGTNASEGMTIYQAQGQLPNTGSQLYQNMLVPSFSGTTVSVLAGYGDGRYVWGLVPGDTYAMFRNMQCELFFESSQFLVSVNVGSRQIVVVLKANSSIPDIDPTGALKLSAFVQPRVFSETDASLTTSKFGSTLATNVNYAALHAGINNTLALAAPFGNMTYNTMINGTAEALNSLVDNVLVGFSSAQIMVANDTQETATEFCKPALRLGANTYIYVLLVFSLLLVVTYIEEAGRTRLWRRLTPFDATNVKCAIVGGAAGNDALLRAAATRWNGSADDRDLGRVTLKLRTRNGYGWEHASTEPRQKQHSVRLASLAGDVNEEDDDRIQLVPVSTK